jgi:propanediol dehydratase small subunit
MSENAQRMAVCVGESAAREKLALNCGERASIALFQDIRLPVKLAFAYRADGLGQALLEHANSIALQYEAKECANRLSEWKKANGATFAKLKRGDSIPEDLARQCPRNGYFVAGESEYDRVRCAVHNYRGFGEVQMQFVKAEIPTGRWLRACITKDGSKRRLTLDFYRPAEVK